MLNSTENEIYHANNVWYFKNVYEHENTSSESLKARTFFIFQHISFYEQLKFHSQLS